MEIKIPDHVINNPRRYVAVVEARIRSASLIKRNKEWLAADETRADLLRYMKASKSQFVKRLLESYRDYGTLTERQEEAARFSLMAYDQKVSDNQRTLWAKYGPSKSE